MMEVLYGLHILCMTLSLISLQSDSLIVLGDKVCRLSGDGNVQALAVSQDAAGGAQALRVATDQAAEQVAQWLTPFLKP